MSRGGDRGDIDYRQSDILGYEVDMKNLFLAVLLFWVFILGGLAKADSVELKAMLIGAAGWLSIQNVGHSPVHIINIKVNDRDDCNVVSLSELTPSDPDTREEIYRTMEVPMGFPIRSNTNLLKVGDISLYRSSCNVVRITVETDQGSVTLDWGSIR
jgi:hypothetical protein